MALLVVAFPRRSRQVAPSPAQQTRDNGEYQDRQRHADAQYQRQLWRVGDDVASSLSTDEQGNRRDVGDGRVVAGSRSGRRRRRGRLVRRRKAALADETGRTQAPEGADVERQAGSVVEARSAGAAFLYLVFAVRAVVARRANALERGVVVRLNTAAACRK